MIYSISGEVLDIGIDYAVIDNNGIGYLIYVTSNTLEKIHIGQTAILYTSFIVREDSMTLYGFVDKADRDIFNILLSVSGVGPKLALACLTIYDSDSLAVAISNSDLKALEKIPGVGKRSAQRMILEIGDKLGSFANTTFEHSTVKKIDTNISDQVIQALIQLGFNSVLAENAIEQVSQTGSYNDTSSLLKQCLVFLGDKRG